MEADRAEASNGTNDALRLLEARSFIDSTLSLEYGLADMPNKPQIAFCCLQAKLPEKKEALRVATAKVGTLQALLDTDRESSTSSPTLERELVCLHHSYGKLQEVTRDLGFDATGLLRSHPLDDPILHIGFGMLCKAMSDHLGHV